MKNKTPFDVFESFKHHCRLAGEELSSVNFIKYQKMFKKEILKKEKGSDEIAEAQEPTGEIDLL